MAAVEKIFGPARREREGGFDRRKCFIEAAQQHFRPGQHPENSRVAGEVGGGGDTKLVGGKLGAVAAYQQLSR